MQLGIWRGWGFFLELFIFLFIIKVKSVFFPLVFHFMPLYSSRPAKIILKNVH